MDTTKNATVARPFTAVEFCAGYAGIHLGLARAIPNLQLLALCEIEAFPVANLVAKMEAGLLDSAPIWTDLKTFPGRAFRGQVDLLVAGYPCQPFSAAGKRGGTDDPRHLWPFIRTTVREMRPRYCFFENVEGHISLGLSTVISDLEEDGYTATWGVFSASEVGAPHQRKRVFILASLDDTEGREPKLNAELFGQTKGKDNSIGCSGDSCAELAHCNDSGGGEDQLRPELRTTGAIKSPGGARLQCAEGETSEVTLWPSRPGEEQHCWEPPRVTGRELANNERGECERRAGAGSCGGVGQPNQAEELLQGRPGHDESGPLERPMGRDPHGAPGRLDHAELYLSCDNRVDELRLLGNGVVPATAERAWRVLFERLRGVGLADSEGRVPRVAA